jgi:hypothetical protein
LKVIGGGALPMDLLSDRIHAWVEKEKARPGSTAQSIR